MTLYKYLSVSSMCANGAKEVLMCSQSCRYPSLTKAIFSLAAGSRWISDYNTFITMQHSADLRLPVFVHWSLASIRLFLLPS